MLNRYRIHLPSTSFSTCQTEWIYTNQPMPPHTNANLSVISRIRDREGGGGMKNTSCDIFIMRQAFVFSGGLFWQQQSLYILWHRFGLEEKNNENLKCAEMTLENRIFYATYDFLYDCFAFFDAACFQLNQNRP